MWNTDAILKVDDAINPTTPTTHWCYEATDTLYIVQRDNKRLIVIRSCGSLGAEYAIDTRHEYHADQTGRSLGSGKVVGIVIAGKIEGEVPARKLPYYVFK